LENTEIVTVKIMTEQGNIILKGYARTYKNLMSFLSAKLEMDDMGECKGMGRCGTCQIRVENNLSIIGDYDGNELNTLKMLDNTDPNVRLACKIHFNELIDNIVISII
jgi:ferredoxin, 2Fe-2S